MTRDPFAGECRTTEHWFCRSCGGPIVRKYRDPRIRECARFGTAHAFGVGPDAAIALRLNNRAVWASVHRVADLLGGAE